MAPKIQENSGTNSTPSENAAIIVLNTSQGPIEDISFVVNCAGLYACDVANKLNIADVPKARYAQGNYWRADFLNSGNNAPKKHANTDIDLAKEGLTMEEVSSPDTLSTAKKRYFNRLIYPLPEKGGLGTHLTLDLDGSIRFGPNVKWADDSLMLTRESEQNWYQSVQPPDDGVYDAIRRYFPGVGGDLVPDYAGLRPKLEDTTDFVFMETLNSISCLGIESPGLTSSLAIGDNVARRVEEKLADI